VEIPSVSIFVRHSADCEYRDDENYRKCRCKKHLRWTHKGKQYRRAAKTRTWSGAEEARRALEAEFTGGVAVPVLKLQPKANNQPTIAQAIKTFIHRGESANKKPSTIRKLRFQLNLFEQFMGKRSKFYPAQITADDVTEYRTTWVTRWNDLTKIKAQQNLRGFLRSCLRGDHRTDVLDVLDTIKQTKQGKEKRKPKPFTEDELEHLLDEIPTVFANEPTNIEKYRTLIRCMVSTGLAIVDTVQLERASLEHAKKAGVLEVERQKTGKKAIIPIDSALLKELQSVLNGDPRYIFWNGTSTADSETKRLQEKMRTLMKAANVYIPGDVFHRFRDTAVDFWLGQGWSLTDVATALGDTVKMVEEHYKDWASQRLKERLAKLPVRKWRNP
jgi:integrase/recombinase XerD